MSCNNQALRAWGKHLHFSIIRYFLCATMVTKWLFIDLHYVLTRPILICTDIVGGGIMLNHLKICSGVNMLNYTLLYWGAYMLWVTCTLWLSCIIGRDLLFEVINADTTWSALILTIPRVLLLFCLSWFFHQQTGWQWWLISRLKCSMELVTVRGMGFILITSGYGQKYFDTNYSKNSQKRAAECSQAKKKKPG